eukprot:scaffold1208_cov163-Ochromonas_danica.AAC.14
MIGRVFETIFGSAEKAPRTRNEEAVDNDGEKAEPMESSTSQESEVLSDDAERPPSPQEEENSYFQENENPISLPIDEHPIVGDGNEHQVDPQPPAAMEVENQHESIKEEQVEEETTLPPPTTAATTSAVVEAEAEADNHDLASIASTTLSTADLLHGKKLKDLKVLDLHNILKEREIEFRPNDKKAKLIELLVSFMKKEGLSEGVELPDVPQVSAAASAVNPPATPVVARYSTRSVSTPATVTRSRTVSTPATSNTHSKIDTKKSAEQDKKASKGRKATKTVARNSKRSASAVKKSIEEEEEEEEDDEEEEVHASKRKKSVHRGKSPAKSPVKTPMKSPMKSPVKTPSKRTPSVRTVGTETKQVVKTVDRSASPLVLAEEELKTTASVAIQASPQIDDDVALPESTEMEVQADLGFEAPTQALFEVENVPQSEPIMEEEDSDEYLSVGSGSEAQHSLPSALDNLQHVSGSQEDIIDLADEDEDEEDDDSADVSTVPEEVISRPMDAESDISSLHGPVDSVISAEEEQQQQQQPLNESEQAVQAFNKLGAKLLVAANSGGVSEIPSLNEKEYDLLRAMLDRIKPASSTNAVPPSATHSSDVPTVAPAEAAVKPVEETVRENTATTMAPPSRPSIGSLQGTPKDKFPVFEDYMRGTPRQSLLGEDFSYSRPRTSLDGGLWKSRESFLSTPGYEVTPQKPVASVLFDGRSKLADRMPTPFHRATVSEAKLADRMPTPFHRATASEVKKRTLEDMMLGSESDSPAAKRVSIDPSFTNASVSKSVPGSAMSTASVRFGYTPTFVSQAVVFKPPQDILQRESKDSLSYIQRRRLQRQTVGSQSVETAKKILQTLNELSTPAEEAQKVMIPRSFEEKRPSVRFQQPDTGKSALPSHRAVFAAAQADTTGSKFDAKKSVTEKALSSTPLAASNKASTAQVSTSTSEAANKSVSFAAPADSKGPRHVRFDAGSPSSNGSNISSAAVDSEFQFGDPVVVEDLDDVDVRDSAIKFVFSPGNMKKKRSRDNDKNEVSKALPSTENKTADTKKALPSSSTVKTTSSVVPSKTEASNNASTAAIPSIWTKVATDIVKCKVCYVQNKKGATKCVSCESPLEGGSSSTTSSSSAPTTSNVIFSSSAATTATAPSAFIFGAPASNTSSSNNSAAPAPVSSFSFGSTGNKNSGNQMPAAIAPAASGFSFSAAPAASSSSFSFGVAPPSSETKLASVAPVSSKPAFGQIDKNEDGDDENLSKKRRGREETELSKQSNGFSTSSSFSFGASGESSSKPATTGFSFGVSAPVAVTANSAPSLDFGKAVKSDVEVKATVDADDKTAKADVKPISNGASFSFAATSSAGPSFSFGAKPITTPAAASSNPVSTFSFGAKESQPAAATEVKEAPKQATAFPGFGSTSAGTTNGSGSFAFGGSKPAVSAFGSDNTENKASLPQASTKPADIKPSFITPVPAFTFGASSSLTDSSKPVAFTATPASATSAAGATSFGGFGSVAPAASTSSMPPSIFGASGSSEASKVDKAPSAPSSTFTFGASSSAAAPAAINPTPAAAAPTNILPQFGSTAAPVSSGSISFGAPATESKPAQSAFMFGSSTPASNSVPAVATMSPGGMDVGSSASSDFAQTCLGAPTTAFGAPSSSLSSAPFGAPSSNANPFAAAPSSNTSSVFGSSSSFSAFGSSGAGPTSAFGSANAGTSSAFGSSAAAPMAPFGSTSANSAAPFGMTSAPAPSAPGFSGFGAQGNNSTFTFGAAAPPSTSTPAFGFPTSGSSGSLASQQSAFGGFGGASTTPTGPFGGGFGGPPSAGFGGGPAAGGGFSLGADDKSTRRKVRAKRPGQ